MCKDNTTAAPAKGFGMKGSKQTTGYKIDAAISGAAEILPAIYYSCIASTGTWLW
jgi:hypothetical protein